MKVLDGHNVKLDYSKEEIWIYANSNVEKQSRAFSCAKEPETIEWMESNVKPNDIVLDIGANVGAYSLIMGKLVGEGGMIYSFEPNWVNYHQLNRNIILNDLTNTIAALNVAVSNSEGIEVFNYQDLEFGSSLHTLGKPVNFVGNVFKPKYTQQVMKMSVDNLIGDFGVKQPNHMKIDVDGVEADVIEGAMRTISSPSFKSLMVEFNEDFDSDQAAIEKIKSVGFRVVRKAHNPSRFFKSDGVFNYYFER